MANPSTGSWLRPFVDTMAAKTHQHVGISNSWWHFGTRSSTVITRSLIRPCQSSAATDLLDFIRQFRAGLPQEVLESSSYSLRVFLVPKLANRAGTADLSVEFVPFDRSRPEEMEGLKKVAALIKDRHVPVASSGLMKPGEVVRKLAEGLPFQVTMHTHTQAWRVYGVRPGTGAEDPRDTRSQYCLYDDLSGSYGYTQAWVDYLRRKLSDPQEFERVTGAPPVETDRAVT